MRVKDNRLNQAASMRDGYAGYYDGAPNESTLSKRAWKGGFHADAGGKGGYGQMWRGKAVPSQGFSTVNGE